MITRIKLVVFFLSVFYVEGSIRNLAEKDELQISDVKENQPTSVTPKTYYYSELILVGNCRLLNHETAYRLTELASSFLAKFGIMEPNLQIVECSCKKNFVIKFYTSRTTLGMYSLYTCPHAPFCVVKFRRSRFHVKTFHSEIPQIFEYKRPPVRSRRNMYLVMIASAAFGLLSAFILGIIALYCGWFASNKQKYVYTMGIAAYSEPPRIFSTKGPVNMTAAATSMCPAKGGNFLEALNENADYDIVDDTPTSESFTSDEEYETSQEIYNLPQSPDLSKTLDTPDIQRIPEFKKGPRNTTELSPLEDMADTNPPSVSTLQEAKNSKTGLTNIRFVKDKPRSFPLETDL